MEIIQLYKDDADVFINLETVSRMSFSKSDALKQSEREVKIVFTDGANCVYTGHRDLVKALKIKAKKSVGLVEEDGE